MSTITDIYETADLWPIYENATSEHSIGYIVATDDIPGLPYPRIGEVYRTPRGWAAWPMGSVFGDDENPPQSYLGFTTRRYAVEYLIAYAQDRARWDELPERRPFDQAEFDAFCADPKRQALVKRILAEVGMEES